MGTKASGGKGGGGRGECHNHGGVGGGSRLDPLIHMLLTLAGHWGSQPQTSVSRWLSEDKPGMVINLTQMRIWETNPITHP